MNSDITPSCRLCGSAGLKFLFSVKGHRVSRCRQCDFVQVVEKPAPEEFLAIYGVGYFSHDKYKDKSTLARENHRRLSLVRAYLPKSSKILEVGCGVGDFISHANREYEMAGFDPSEHAIGVARKTNPELGERLWAGSIEDRALPKSYYDGICLWDVVEHLWDIVPTQNALLESLKPGGCLFFSTPCTDSLAAWILGKYWFFMTPPEHLSFFGGKSFRYLFERILKLKVIHYSARGKWANVGFLLYKAQRVAPGVFRPGFLKLMEFCGVGNIAVYVPGGNIFYAVVRKAASEGV